MHKKRKLINILIILSLLAALIGSMGASTLIAQAKAHPLINQLAVQQPESNIQIIVQKLDRNLGVETQVVRLGGKVTRDLRLINAFTAQMSSWAALALAKSPGVRWISPDASVISTGRHNAPSGGKRARLPQNYYLDTLGVRQTWSMGLNGQGIGVAVIDSGIAQAPDFLARASRKAASRIKVEISLNELNGQSGDTSGHGTHVAGIIGGNGVGSQGRYMGIAPQVNLISLKVSDENGMAYESDVVEAMQWIFDHKSEYNIRVVNLSFNSTLEQSYHTSPLDAAAEILWFNGVVVVASAGNWAPDNQGSPINASPANDPFIITVGASNENLTADITDDSVASFSAYGPTLDGFAKPDIVAPGKDIISVLATSSDWVRLFPERIVLAGRYIRLSGTSMSAPMVTGAVALLLQDEPELTPDQVKYRLVHTANTISSEDGFAFPYLNVYAAITGDNLESANTSIAASQLLWSGPEPVIWDSVAWNSVAWNSVSWNSVSWNSVSWNSVSWNSVFWGP